MELVIGPDNPDVSLYSNGRSLGVDMEVRILVVSEALVVMVALVDMLVLVVTLVKVVMLVMVATVQVPSHLLDSIYGFTECFL
jgi:hypothetical protein